jgi:hypothetical protein
MEDGGLRAACWGTDSLVGPPLVGELVMTDRMAKSTHVRQAFQPDTSANSPFELRTALFGTVEHRTQFIPFPRACVSLERLT